MADAKPFHWEYTPPPAPPEVFRIEGGRPLHGNVRVSGAKNAALKMLAAATLTGERCRLTNVPEIEDVRVMAETLRELGVVVDHPSPGVYEVASGDVDWLFVPLEAAAKMRASFILLGPLLARFGRVIISNPGGDRIGRRPVDLHVEAMRALGADIEYRNGYYFARTPGRLRGTDNQVYQKFWTGAKGWSGWFALGAPAGGFQGAPAVISRNNTVCNIYVRGTDNALWQKAWFNNAWHDWGRHNDGGVLASEPALGSMGPDHEHVFIRGTDNQVWQKFWTAAKGWSGWFALGAPPGGFQGAPSVISRNGSVCNIYVRGGDNALWQKAWFNNAWHDWGRHNDGGVLASEPAPGSMGPNHEHVFVRGTDSQVWQKWWNG